MITDKMLGDPQKLGWSIGMVVAVAGASSLLCYFMALGGYRALLQAPPAEPASAHYRSLVDGRFCAGRPAGSHRPPDTPQPGKVTRVRQHRGLRRQGCGERGWGSGGPT